MTSRCACAASASGSSRDTAGAMLLMVPGSHAQVQLSLDPAMTKGAATSPVTIVEFSDYQ